MLKKIQIFLASIDQEHKEKFDRSVVNPRNLKNINSDLIPKWLKNKNEVNLWGFSHSQKNSSIWNKISENDWFLFYVNGKYSYAGQVLNKIHEAKLASKLWDVNTSIDKMEMIVFFKNITEVSLGFLKTNRLLGIDSSIPSIHRITLIQANQSFVYEIVRKHKNVKNFIQTTSESETDNKKINILPSDLNEPPEKFRSNTIRFIRDTKKSATLKKLYSDKCQICGYTISLENNQWYSEAHHVWPLGEGGVDDYDNMVVLCPNHHAEFDYAIIGFDSKNTNTIIDKTGKVLGKIHFRKDHSLDSSNIEYHKSRMKGNYNGP